MDVGRHFSSPCLPRALRRRRLLSLVLVLLCVGGRGASAARVRDGSERYDLRQAVPAEPDVEDEDEVVEYMDPNPPEVRPSAEDQPPACSLLLLQYGFAHTVGAPPVAVNYTPPETCRWNRAVLEFSASCAGEQNDRIAAVWLDGVEMLRTSTAKPVSPAAVFWKVRKDVTHLSSLLTPKTSAVKGGEAAPASARVLSVMLENSVDDHYKGVYHVNVTLHFFGRGLAAPEPKAPGLLRLPLSMQQDVLRQQQPAVSSGWAPAEPFVPVKPRYGDDVVDEAEEEDTTAASLVQSVTSAPYPSEQQKVTNLLRRPADLVIPVANRKARSGGEAAGFWFRIEKEGEQRGGKLRIPRNAYRAVLEVCVSSHGDDEFWYANPPDSYNLQNNIPSRRGNWAFREVVVTVDGLYAGSVIPFPVVFPGAVNPFLWTPVVAIKAFDMPTYDVDLTPFLGNLLNGRPHAVGFEVSHAIPFWLVNGNLHLWLDPHQAAVPAMLTKHHAEPTFLSRNANHKLLDGHFQLEAARQARFEGWVRSSLGNFTTLVDSHFKYKSSVEYRMEGSLKEVLSQSKHTTDTRISEQPANHFLARVINQAKYPVRMLAATAGCGGGDDGGRMLSTTNFSHILHHFTDVTLDQARSQASVTDTQVAGGWLQPRDGSLTGGSETEQTYQRKDNGRCNTRKVTTRDGGITGDLTTIDCNVRPGPPI